MDAFPAQPADFGPPLDTVGVSGPVELADDGSGVCSDDVSTFCEEDDDCASGNCVHTSWGCDPLANEFSGRIALLDRGFCSVDTKVKHAQDAGASAAIVANQANNGLPPMSVVNPLPGITIPSVGVSLADGDLLKSAPPGVRVTLLDDTDRERVIWGGPTPTLLSAGDFNRDGAADLVVTHPGLGGGFIILTNHGDGSFFLTHVFPNPGVWQLAVDDFNLDGFDDIAYVTFPTDDFSLLINTGDGQFASLPGYISGSHPVAVISADFNEDGAPDLAAVNTGSDSVSVLLNRIGDRVDTNGSNLVDGFDLTEVHRRLAIRAGETGYDRLYDVDLNGVIDGDDLASVASRFGETIRQASPLLARIDNPLPADPNTITLQPRASEGNRLTVDVFANTDSVFASSAEFAVTYGPGAGDPDPTPVLEAVGDEPGDYFSGGLTQALDVDLGNLGEATVRVTRLPSEDRAGGQRRLMSLIFEARRPGATSLEFSPIPGRAAPALLDSNGNPVSVDFVGGVTADVVVLQERALGQKISFSPELLDFGIVQGGAGITKTVRLANFGFADPARPRCDQHTSRVLVLLRFAVHDPAVRRRRAARPVLTHWGRVCTRES